MGHRPLDAGAVDAGAVGARVDRPGRVVGGVEPDLEVMSGGFWRIQLEMALLVDARGLAPHEEPVADRNAALLPAAPPDDDECLRRFPHSNQCTGAAGRSSEVIVD